MIARLALVLSMVVVGAGLGVGFGILLVRPGDGMVAGAKVVMGLLLGGGGGLVAGALVAWRGGDGLRRGALWLAGPVSLALLAGAGWRIAAQNTDAPAPTAGPRPAVTAPTPDGG